MKFVEGRGPGIDSIECYEIFKTIIKKLNIDSDKIQRVVNNLKKYFEEKQAYFNKENKIDELNEELNTLLDKCKKIYNSMTKIKDMIRQGKINIEEAEDTLESTEQEYIYLKDQISIKRKQLQDNYKNYLKKIEKEKLNSIMCYLNELNFIINHGRLSKMLVLMVNSIKIIYNISLLDYIKSLMALDIEYDYQTLEQLFSRIIFIEQDKLTQFNY